jgi:hypothetical protein
MAKSIADVMVADSAGAIAQRRRFFLAMAVVLLALVLVGFAPTFYLRAYLGTAHLSPLIQTLPTHLQVHGVVLTAWFVLIVVQSLLVASHRTALHRRFGVAGAILAAALVVTTLMVLIRAVPRFLSSGLPEDQMPRFALFIIGDMGALVTFSCLVASAVYLRRQPEVQKRLMLLASISIAGPAVARLPGVSALPLLVVPLQVGLLVAVILHDIVSIRRVHLATVWGVAFSLAVRGLSTAVALSAIGRAVILDLG